MTLGEYYYPDDARFGEYRLTPEERIRSLLEPPNARHGHRSWLGRPPAMVAAAATAEPPPAHGHHLGLVSRGRRSHLCPPLYISLAIL
jgi:hypothetical protein